MKFFVEINLPHRSLITTELVLFSTSKDHPTPLKKLTTLTNSQIKSLKISIDLQEEIQPIFNLESIQIKSTSLL